MSSMVSVPRLPRAKYEASPIIYQLMKWIITALVHFLYRYTVIGKENVPRHGPLIVAVNHLHMLDPGIVAPAIPRQIITLAAGKWKEHFAVRSFLQLAGVIYVRRGKVDRRALRACLDILHQGRVLALAPEGTRSRTGMLQRAKPGITYLATKAGAVILPVGFWGVEKIGQWKRFKRPQCHITIGRPFRLPRLPGERTADTLQDMADKVMLRIGLLLPEAYRGVYAKRIAAIEAGQSDELADLQPV